MAIQQLRELKNISAKRDLAEILKNDGDTTKKKVDQKTNKVSTAIGRGLAYGLGYFLIPTGVGYVYGITMVRRYGDFRDDQLQEKEGEQKQRTRREKWHESIRKWGNETTPRLKKYSRYGLGDFLTEDINLRKMGTALGGITPLASWYAAHIAYSDPLGGTFWGTVSATILWPIISTGSLLSSGIGYKIGNKGDKLLGDESPRFIDDR